MFAFLRAAVGGGQKREEESPHISLHEEVAFQNFNCISSHFSTFNTC